MARDRIITNHEGNVYNFPIRIVGFLIALIGLVAITFLEPATVIAGTAFVFIGLYFALLAFGIDIDVDTRSVRQYKSLAGMKFGRFIEYTTYNNICIIRKNKKKKGGFKQEEDSGGPSPFVYEIHLLSRSHRGKVLLEKVYNREEAEEAAKEYARAMRCSIVEYNPPGKAKKRGEDDQESSKKSRRSSGRTNQSGKRQSEN